LRLVLVSTLQLVLSSDSRYLMKSNSRSSGQGFIPCSSGGGEDGIKLTPLGNAFACVTSILEPLGEL
jgi:hypothetical protein